MTYDSRESEDDFGSNKAESYDRDAHISALRALDEVVPWEARCHGETLVQRIEYVKAILAGATAALVWPTCVTCKKEFEFDWEEPFAYCKCGTTEWGDSRPEIVQQVGARLRRIAAMPTLEEARATADADNALPTGSWIAPEQMHRILTAFVQARRK